MIQLIGNEVCGSTFSLCSPISDSDIARMFLVAYIHGVARILGSALLNNNLLKGDKSKNFYCEQVYATIYRYENYNYVMEKVCDVLETEKIPYIPLKGSVIKKHYPQPWMRLGCDIDILVHEEDAQKAADTIIRELGYEKKSTGKHDIQILSTENIYVELHFTLMEEDVFPAMSRVLNKAWEHAKPCEETKNRYEFDDAMFSFYHIAHMAKHFLVGGCGLRPFLDLWLMENSKNYDTPDTVALLKESGLTDFAKVSRKLSRVWFSGEKHDKVTRIMEEYIISGGCFDSKETRMFSQQQKAGGKLKYMFSRLFVSYDALKSQYPIIIMYKFLIPICEIFRIFIFLFGKKKKIRKEYVKNLNNMSDERIDEMNFLFESVGF
jgi:hypothetical protein